MVERATDGLELFGLVRERYDTLREAVAGGPRRAKRGIIDVGGTALQWLFGVATSQDLEELNGQLQALGGETSGIVGAVAHQATLVNETLRELEEHVLAMQQLDRAHQSLEKEFNKWRQNVVSAVNALESQVIMTTRVDEAFRAAQKVLDWASMALEDIGIGLALLATGNLPPELFPPTQLRSVLKEIRASLAMGWALTSALQNGDLWRAYQEARVVVAATTNGLRLFIHLPIIEITKTFELYRTFVLPVFSAAGNAGLHYAPIPAFLVVGRDRQTFIELTETEVRSCQGRASSVCPPSKAINRKNFKKTCVMALFLQDTDKKKTECDHVVVEWRGPEAIYLGHRRWAVSMNNLRSLVMECPQQTDSRDSSRAELPLVGIVEIPHGCSIQTDEWILQASRQHSLSSTRKGNDFVPRLKEVNWAVATDAQQQGSMTSGKSTNSSLQASLEASLKRIGGSLTNAASFGKTIRALEVDDSEREKRAAEHHKYPFELWGVGAALFMVSVAVCSIQWCRGRKGDVNMADLRERLRMVEEFVEEEAEKRRVRRWSTMHCLTEIDNRMAAHEEACLTTLRKLESSFEHLA
ncbi:uncharacterized protein LOC130688124 [Daphnia carinata]|uniref:uncharacterized protein LOC130688124 n=1 Tax=Daphnia carinata TaxID=120202 RepID=UPI002868F757|nr:uncharacterized protein LOC130688124 [Daphnia carinata]